MLSCRRKRLNAACASRLELRIRISRRGGGSVRCSGSRARVQPRDFFPPTPPSTTPHMGCFQSSSFISALCMLLGVWIRSVSPSSPCSPDDRITSHPVELVGSDHNPSCSRASGSGWRDHPFSRRVSAPGVDPRSPPARIRRSRRVQLRWKGVKSLSHRWSVGVGLSHRVMPP